jgi:hypothetical protein
VRSEVLMAATIKSTVELCSLVEPFLTHRCSPKIKMPVAAWTYFQVERNGHDLYETNLTVT